jgi:signal transduction histidine kinase
MSVRVRLTLLNMLVFALALGIFGAMVRVQVEHTLSEGVNWQLTRRSKRVVPRDGKFSLAAFETIRLRWVEHNEKKKDQKDQKVIETEPFRYPFYDIHGKNLLQPELVAFDPSALDNVHLNKAPYFSTVGNNRLYTVVLTSVETGEPIYYQISESLIPMNSELNRLTRTLLTMIPIALLIAGGGGMFLTGRALAPIREVTAAAGRIGVEDLSERLPVRGKDEFAKLEETFNGMLERLESAFERQKRFVADASHELKTPLTVIKANSSLALADPDLAPDYRETLVEIDQAADRTSRLVQDLLLLARTDHGQLPLKENEVVASKLFAGALAEARKLHPEAAAITLEVGNECFWGDAHLLHRLLLNLLDNALRHTPKTGGVTLTAHASGFVVRDTGEGVSEEHLGHLGERFYRVDSARARTGGGTGLGLAISRAIAEAHGGKLELQSELGRGTTVRVTLAPHQ